MAGRVIPREPGEQVKLIGFRASMSMDARIEEKAADAGMGKAQWLRAVIGSALKDDQEVAA